MAKINLYGSNHFSCGIYRYENIRLVKIHDLISGYLQKRITEEDEGMEWLEWLELYNITLLVTAVIYIFMAISYAKEWKKESPKSYSDKQLLRIEIWILLIVFLSISKR